VAYNHRGQRRCRRNRGLLSLWAMVPLLATGLALTTTVESASAATCGYSSYQYVANASNNLWEGIEASIKDDSQTVGNYSSDHAAAWIDVVNEGDTECVDGHDNWCWIQVGDADGDGGNGVSKDSVTVYHESADLNQYTFAWSTLSPDTYNYYSDFDTNIENGDDTRIEWYDYVTIDGVVTRLGAAWFPTYDDFAMTAQVDSESYVGDTSAACPDWPSNQEFGYNSSGVTASSAISLSPDGSTWDEWNTTEDSGAPYTTTSSDYTGPDYHAGSDYYAWNMFGDGS
jgi:hypothetical protein